MDKILNSIRLTTRREEGFVISLPRGLCHKRDNKGSHEFEISNGDFMKCKHCNGVYFYDN
jgi:hypothetical protein